MRGERALPEPRAGAGARARGDRHLAPLGLAVREGAAGRRRGRGHPRRGLDAAGDGRLGRRGRPVQARVRDADRVVQGPRHDRDGELPEEPRHPPGAGGLVRERGRVALGVRRAERPRVPDPRAGDRVVPEDRPDRRVRRRRRHDQGLQAGRGRGRAPAERRDLLREPQLAALLRGGREDARLRAVGAARLPGARQRGRPPRLRQQRAGLRPRLRRAPPTGRDRQGSPSLRRPGGELRALLRGLSRRCRAPRPHHDRLDGGRGHRVGQAHARRRGAARRARERRGRRRGGARRRSSRRSATWRAGASTWSPRRPRRRRG